MSRNYKFYNPDGVYFISFVPMYIGIEWLDVFTHWFSVDRIIYTEALRIMPVKKEFGRCYCCCVVPRNTIAQERSMDCKY